MKNFALGTLMTLTTGTTMAVTEGAANIPTPTNGQLIISAVAGVASTVIINILKAKFPKLFKPIKSKTNQ